MNLPNRLTVSRLALTLVFLAALFSRARYSESVALILFSVASLTDYYDGKIARRDKLITDFGILMDPLADKILVCSAFIVFVDLQLMPAWMVVVVVARELSITGLRLLAASKNVVLAAERYGKHKTISQIVAILAVLLCMSYPQWGKWSDSVFSFWLPVVKTLSLYVAVILTITSGSLYLWRNRALYSKDL
jgi:CDP-diacylglycerol--glycerol-3-phosphate 3-phosphatidyltransferase